MNAGPRIAVVIPAFEAAATIAAAVASARDQTVAPAEIVVVDDGSTDQTAANAAAAGARVLRQANAGPGAARNAGIRATAGEFVAFLDADDTFVLDKLALQVAALADHGVVACCSDAWLLRDGARVGRKHAGRSIPATIGYADLLAGNPVIASSVLARREALLAAGLFDEDRDLIATEDYDLWLRLARRGGIAYLDTPLVGYRIGQPSLGSTARFLSGIDKIMRKLGEERAPVRVRARLDRAAELVAAGQGRAARALLREARALGARGLEPRKVWLRSWVAGMRGR